MCRAKRPDDPTNRNPNLEQTMTEAAKTHDKANEPGQAALDTLNLARIRNAITVHDAAVSDNNKRKNTLRTVYASTSLQNLDNEAAGIALKLVEGGDEAIEKYCKTVRNVGVYVGYLGKVLSPAQYDLFGMAGTGPTPEDERAKIEGRSAGFSLDDEKGSKESDSPYEIGSIKGQAWLKAFRQARSERDAIMAMQQPAAEETTAETEGDEGKA
jgi:hypothetical protein